MLLPKRGPFPQISQTLAMFSPYILLRKAIKTFFLFRCQPGEDSGTVPKFSPGNSKFQIPNLKQTPNLKFQTQNPFKDRRRKPKPHKGGASTVRVAPACGRTQPEPWASAHGPFSFVDFSFRTLYSLRYTQEIMVRGYVLK